MRSQRGFSLLVVMAMAIVAATVVLMFLKIIPVYSEYYALKDTLDTLASQTGKSDYELRRDFSNRAIIQDIVSVKAQDLVIVSSPSVLGVGVRYSREVPLKKGIKLVFDFEYQAGTPVLKDTQ
ncbi:MAG: DUF4845 domain-containing protein [Vogesella sp.]|uniref:DUF4845 domain-containing protein n=1 Tax=Vogesella sp. TaxID=1904252 RepID=UPI00391D8E44